MVTAAWRISSGSQAIRTSTSFAPAIMTEDKEGVAAFLERRKPRFRGNSANGLNCANAKLTKLLKLNLNSHPISRG